MKMNRTFVIGTVLATGTSLLGLQARQASEAELKLHPVRPQTIQVHGFWNQQYKRLVEKWIPHCIEQMEQGGRGQELLNLVYSAQILQGKDAGGKFSGLRFSDAYVYNVVEAICLALAIDPQDDAELAEAQQFLRRKMEEWIPIILAAQEPDGYIHSHHTLAGNPRYKDTNAHEFYVQGYFLEMGVAHYRLTGGKDRRLYDAAVKCANHLYRTFGPEPKRMWFHGHPGMGYALCRLARLVDEVEGTGEGDKYVDLAKYLLDNRHKTKQPRIYNQSHKPVVEMDEAVGHAVRATYFYTAMADLAARTRDEAYLAAVDKIWDSAIHRKHYITGGVGASHRGEAFDADYKLPNNGYCESCAGSGMSFWADRMHRIHGSAHYHDVIERVLYNNVLGAIELSGKNFFYENPLSSDKARHPWHHCPCCVGNMPRTLLTLKDRLYSLNDAKDVLYVNQFVASTATIPEVAGEALTLKQETDYPWSGLIAMTLEPGKPGSFTVKLRIPDRTESALYMAIPDLSGRFTVKINGEKQDVSAEDGYVSLTRKWQKGDRIELELPMDVQRVYCDERVQSNRGRVALQRGPIVYNIESVDHSQDVKRLELKPDARLHAVFRDDLLGGVMAIECEDPKALAIPNYVRLNRGGWSQVWIVEDFQKALEAE